MGMIRKYYLFYVIIFPWWSGIRIKLLQAKAIKYTNFLLFDGSRYIASIFSVAMRIFCMKWMDCEVSLGNYVAIVKSESITNHKPYLEYTNVPEFLPRQISRFALSVDSGTGGCGRTQTVSNKQDDIFGISINDLLAQCLLQFLVPELSPVGLVYSKTKEKKCNL